MGKMGINEVKIVGIKEIENKEKKRTSWVYYYVGEFTQYEVDNSVVQGNSCGNVYTTTDYGVHIGDLVELKFAPGFEGKAQLAGIQILKPSQDTNGK